MTFLLKNPHILYRITLIKIDFRTDFILRSYVVCKNTAKCCKWAHLAKIKTMNAIKYTSFCYHGQYTSFVQFCECHSNAFHWYLQWKTWVYVLALDLNWNMISANSSVPETVLNVKDIWDVFILQFLSFPTPILIFKHRYRCIWQKLSVFLNSCFVCILLSLYGCYVIDLLEVT